MRKIPSLLLATLLIICKTNFVFAQPGTLDSSFGVNGKVTTMNGNNAAIARQADGKILVAGTMGDFDHVGFHAAISRYNINGSPDSTFGTNGKVETYFDSGRYLGFVATSLLIQPDQKILVGGYIYHLNVGPDNFALVRYLPNGGLDSSFGLDGKEQDFIGGENELYSLGLLTNGDIIAGGWADGYCVVKFKSYGPIDSSFANDGRLINHDLRADPVSDLLLQRDGRIVSVCQGLGSYEVYKETFQINRLLSSGSYDSSLGNNGFVNTDFYGAGNNPFSIVGLSDSSFIAGGYATDSASSTYTALAKYKKNGHLFSSFGTNGKTTVPSATIGNMRLLLQKDDKIISAGALLLRLKPGGTLDSTFGNNGQATDFAGALDAVLQPDGKIITMNSGILQRFIGDQPVVSIAKNISVTEGNAGYTAAKFKIVLNYPTNSTVKINYTTKDGTAQGGSDYVSTSGTVTIKPGKLSKTVTVNVVGDNTHENNEKFSFVLSNPINALLGDLDSATCTIKNDDPLLAQSETNNKAVANTAIKLYPNPVRDKLIVEGLTARNARLSIVDIQGKDLINATASDEIKTIDVKQLSPGVYYLKIKINETTTVLKFLKQ